MSSSAANSLKKSIQIYSSSSAPKKTKKKTVVSASGALVPKKANPLLSYFEIQARENAAAAYIQTVWKRLQILKKWRFYSWLLRTIVKVQGVFRGVITRKYLSRWYVLWIKFIIQVQARIRRYLSNKHLRLKIIEEMRSAVLIQKVIRGFIVRKSFINHLLKTQAAIQIQRLFRGLKARSQSDIMWLSKTLIPVQSMIRKFLSKKKFKIIKYNYNMAAIKIQKLIRIFLAQKKIGSKLLEREKRYRNNAILMLSEEEKTKNEKILSLLDFVSSKKIKEKVKKNIKILQQQEITIFNKEKDFVKNLYEINNLTPRSLELNYKEMLETKNNEIRSELTQLKYNYLFKHTKDFYTAEHNFFKNYDKFISLIEDKNFFLYSKENELDDKKYFLLDYEINELKKEKMLKIADEKRKWKVYFYDSSGKPDKNRRPGKPWSPSVLAPVEKNTYTTGGIINILANIKKETQGGEDVSQLKEPQELAKDAIEKLALQNYLLEIEAYKKVLAPIEKIMNTYTGLQPNVGQPEANQTQTNSSKPTTKSSQKNYSINSTSKSSKNQKVKIIKNKPAIPSILNGWGKIGAEASVALSQLDMLGGGDGGPQGPRILEIQKQLLDKENQNSMKTEDISDGDDEVLGAEVVEWIDPNNSKTENEERPDSRNMKQTDFLSKSSQIYSSSRRSYQSFNKPEEEEQTQENKPGSAFYEFNYESINDTEPDYKESSNISTTNEELDYYRDELHIELDRRKKSSMSAIFQDDPEDNEIEKLNDLPELSVGNEILNTLNSSSQRRQRKSSKSHKYLPSNSLFSDTFNTQHDLNRKIINNQLPSLPPSSSILSKSVPFSLYLNPAKTHQPHSLTQIQKSLLTPIEKPVLDSPVDDKKWYESRMNKKKSLNMIVSSSSPSLPVLSSSETSSLATQDGLNSEFGDLMLYKDPPTEMNVSLSDGNLLYEEKQRLVRLREEELNAPIVKMTPSCNNPEDNKVRLDINSKRRERIRTKNENTVKEKGRSIPWELLDEVDGMEKQFEKQKNYNEFRRGY